MKIAPVAAVISLCILFAGAGYATPACPGSMMREIDDMNRLYLEAGRRYAVVLAATCDERGRVTELLLQRQRDGKKFVWKADDGPARLARIILRGAE